MITSKLLLIYRKRSSVKNNSDASTNMAYSEVKLEPEGGGGGGVYEDPDKLASTGQGNYELTQCPAYESTTSKLQQHVPTEAYAEQSF